LNNNITEIYYFLNRGLKEDRIQSELYQSDYRVGKLGFEKLDREEVQFALFQNSPNPFREVTEIKFAVPQSIEMEFEIFDVNSRLVYKEIITAQKGINSIKLSKDQIGHSGVYMYRLSGGEFSDQRNLLLIE